MANITTQNNIRYCIDTLNTDSQGVFISGSFALSCENATACNGFNLDYNMPANSFLYFLFLISGAWVRLNTSGQAENISSATPDFDLLKEKGNTPAELLALSSIPAFVGQNIGVAVGLLSTDPDNSIPKIKLSVKCVTDSQILKTSKFSPVYNFANAQALKFNTPSEISGTGAVTLYAQVKDKSGNLSEWLPAENFSGSVISYLQFRADYSVSAINASSSACLSSAQIIYSLGNSITNGKTSCEIISHTENWYMNIRSCRLTVKHEPLDLSKIRAFVALRKAPAIIRGESLGIGTGTKKTFALAHPDGVKYDSVRLYFDNVRQYADFEINSQVGRVTCNAPDGVIITCDYEYGWDNEDWQEMNLQHLLSFMDYDQSEFAITLPDNSLSVCAIKISMETQSGNITRENIGKGTGKTQTYKLSRKVDYGEFTIYQNNVALSPKNYFLHDDTQFISISAAVNSTLTASYKWISDTPIIHQFAAVFSE